MATQTQADGHQNCHRNDLHSLDCDLAFLNWTTGWLLLVSAVSTPKRYLYKIICFTYKMHFEKTFFYLFYLSILLSIYFYLFIFFFHLFFYLFIFLFLFIYFYFFREVGGGGVLAWIINFSVNKFNKFSIMSRWSQPMLDNISTIGSKCAKLKNKTPW